MRIDAPRRWCFTFLMPLIKPFRERYPETTLSLGLLRSVYQPHRAESGCGYPGRTLTDSSLRPPFVCQLPQRLSHRQSILPNMVNRRQLEELKRHLCRLYGAGVAEHGLLPAMMVNFVKLPADYRLTAERRSNSCVRKGNGSACLSDYD